jgi:hypothetical protein
MAENSDYQKWETRMQHPHDSVIEVLDKKAKDDGWKTEKHPSKEHGIDLLLQKDNGLVIIEAVGEREKQPNVSGRVKSALGAIIMDMNNEEIGKEYRYCIAFPATQAFERCRIPIRPRQQLKLNIVFVDCYSGLLKVLLPNGRDIGDVIDLSSFDEVFK